MTEKLESKVEAAPSIKEKCVNCLRGANLLKTIVIIVCSGVVIQQITTCVKKLIDIPITTYTHFDFNRTIVYPSVTFCREPPYKYDKLLEYGLYAHPRYTSMWSKFNFSTPLNQLWKDITYEADEFFVQFGLSGLQDSVEVKTVTGFVQGRCYTLSPKILSRIATRESGYSIMLQHNSADIESTTSTCPPGYHVYVHYTREPYTEVTVYNGGMVDYLFVSPGETVDIKLSVNEYHKISDHGDPCTKDDSYSANYCTTQYVWNRTSEAASCSGPWMQSDLPPCDNFRSMTKLISSYLEFYQNHKCTVCPRFCSSYMYNAFVNGRSTFHWDSVSKEWDKNTNEAALQTQLYLYFNNMMVSVFEERYNYDWNLFLSDLGGSVGFLLGLSVIGLLSILGKCWSTIIMFSIKAPKTSKATKDSKASNTSIISKKTYQEGCLTCNKANLKLNYY